MDVSFRGSRFGQLEGDPSGQGGGARDAKPGESSMSTSLRWIFMKPELVQMIEVFGKEAYRVFEQLWGVVETMSHPAKIEPNWILALESVLKWTPTILAQEVARARAKEVHIEHIYRSGMMAYLAKEVSQTAEVVQLPSFFYLFLEGLLYGPDQTRGTHNLSALLVSREYFRPEQYQARESLHAHALLYALRRSILRCIPHKSRQPRPGAVAQNGDNSTALYVRREPQPQPQPQPQPTYPMTPGFYGEAAALAPKAAPRQRHGWEMERSEPMLTVKHAHSAQPHSQSTGSQKHAAGFSGFKSQEDWNRDDVTDLPTVEPSDSASQTKSQHPGSQSPPRDQAKNKDASSIFREMLARNVSRPEKGQASTLSQTPRSTASGKGRKDPNPASDPQKNFNPDNPSPATAALPTLSPPDRPGGRPSDINAFHPAPTHRSETGKVSEQEDDRSSLAAGSNPNESLTGGNVVPLTKELLNAYEKRQQLEQWAQLYPDHEKEPGKGGGQDEDRAHLPVRDEQTPMAEVAADANGAPEKKAFQAENDSLSHTQQILAEEKRDKRPPGLNNENGGEDDGEDDTDAEQGEETENEKWHGTKERKREEEDDVDKEDENEDENEDEEEEAEEENENGHILTLDDLKSEVQSLASKSHITIPKFHPD